MKPPRIQSCIELPLKPDVLEETVAKAKDYTLMHGKRMITLYNCSTLIKCSLNSDDMYAWFSGVSMHSKSAFNRDQVGTAPFILLPSSFPKGEFEKSRRIQTTLNCLMHKVAHDHEFLTEKLKRQAN